MCDTFVALSSATKDGSVIFAKNSDRPEDEAQSIQRYPRQSHGSSATVLCTYIEIPQVKSTAAVLLSQPDWMWGAEMGANEHGVVIGNEAVWTKAAPGPPALLGMDLVRLGLERGGSASQAVEVITGLLEQHGQGGPCAEHDPSLAYDNAFLIADAKEAWVVDTAGQDWAAERITSKTRNISNSLSIRTHFERSSPRLKNIDLDFTAQFSEAPIQVDPTSRAACGQRLLAQHTGHITPKTMMNILSDHPSGLCMHGAFATTASMVSQLFPDGTYTHWMTGAPFPCQTPFKPVFITDHTRAVFNYG